MKRLFTRCLLVTMLMVLGLTTATAQKSVLDESFASGSKPAGWTVGSYWYFSDGNAKFNAPFENGADTMVSPLLNLSELDNQPSVAFTYSIAANGDKVNELQVLYRASEDAEWSVLETFAQATEKTNWKAALPVNSSSIQIAIAGAYKQGGETRVYRLSVENKTEASEAPTGLKIEDLTTNSVTLWWDVCSSPKFVQYNVKVNSSKMTDMSAAADVVDNVGWGITDEFYELSDLKPNKTYWFYVQYDCGDGDVSPWAEMDFRTPCEAISGSFSEDFENAISTCYTIIKGGANAEVSGEYAYNSQRAFKSNSVKGKYNYFILPEFNGNVQNYQVSFMAASADGGNTYARTVTVGVCTEATAEGFTAVKTLNLPKGRVWEQVVVTLKGYNGTGKYIAFQFGNEDKENRLFMDDIRIEAASACPKPMFLEVSEINPNSAKLKWIETGNATEWNLVLSTKPLADPEDIEPDASKGEFAGSISTNPYTAANLQPNTTYFAYVQAGCGSSEWTNAVEFKTSRAVTYPYSEHFDRMDPDTYDETTTNSIPNGWVMDDRCITSGTNYDKQYSSATYRPFVTTKENHEATAYVNAALKLAGASTSGYMSIAMLPAMPKAVNTMMITFWAKATNGNQTLKVGVAKTQTNDLPQGQQLGENITEVGEATILKDEWKQYKVLLTNYTGEGRYITLAPGAPYSGTSYIYIDDIEIDDAPDCNAVSTVSATATGIDKATAEWTDASSSTSWIIKVSSSEIDPSAADGDIVAAQTVNAKTYDITGLAMGQTYYIYVSPTCGDAWMSTTVTTLVGLQVPYYNDFQDEKQGSNAARGPKNWTLGNINVTAALGTQTNIPYVYNTAMTGAPADVVKPNLYFYHSNSATNAGAYAIMPELLNANVKDLKMSFYGSYNSTTVTANYSKGMIRVGVVDNPSDINKTNAFTKVTPIKTLYCSAPKITELFTVDFSEYAGSGKYIVFYSDTAKYNYFMLDNLTISLATDPQPVSDVEASEITKTGAKLTWTENGKAAKWEVKVFAEAPEDPETAEAVWSATVTEKEATVSGLTHSTQYFAYVRSVQDNGNGAWGSTSFFSECGAWAVPFTEDWESWATGANTLSACFTQTAGMQVAGSSSPNATVKTGQVIKFNATSTNKEPMLVLPEFDKPIKTLQLTMNASPYSSSYVGDASYTEIGVLEANDNFVKIAEYRFNLSDVKAWDEVFVNFSAYTGEGGRIAIRTPYATVNKTIHICFDNLVVEEIPLCGRITTIDVADIDSISAKISWEKGKTENAWNLKISSTELEDPATGNADVFSGKVTEQSKVIDGLEGNTTYYIYVQSVDEELECEGQWSNAKSFKTTCKKQTFPYEEDFESYETGSGKDLGCNTLSGPDANHSYISTKGGSKALYLRQATKGNHNYFAFPALAVDSVKRLQLSMQVYSGGTTATTKYAFEVGIMTDPNDPSTFVATHKDTVMGASTAYDRSYTFENYKGDETGTKFGTFIALKSMESTTATGSTSAGYVYIDNVYIDFIETCPAPTDLQTDSVGIYGAKFTWLTDDKTVPHRIRVYDDAAAKPSSEDFVAEVVVSDTTSVIIEGLQSLTKYYAFVRKECAPNDLSKWSSAWAFKTECAEYQSLPYEEGFEDYATGVAPECWTAIQGPKVTGAASSSTQANATVGSTAASGSRGLQISSSGVPTSTSANPTYVYSTASIVTPKLDVNSLKDITMYFDVKGAYADATLKIEAVADGDKEADAFYITTLTDIPSTWIKAYINLSELYTSAQAYKYLRFTPATNGKSIYIDNIVFTTETNIVLPVEDLKLQMLTENSVKFSFAEYTPSVKQWQVAYVAAGGDIADATVKTIDETEYTIEGLAANTSYDIYVRGNVEGDAWVGPLTATTIQDPVMLPYSTGFEDDADKWVIYKTKTVQGNSYPNFFIVGAADKCGAAGEKALFITNDSSSYAYQTKDAQGEIGFSNAWATRNINIEGAGTYKFSFKIKVPANKENESDYATAHLFPAGATILAGNATMLNGTVRAGTAVTDVPANNIYSLMGKTLHENEWIWVTKSIDVEEAGIYTLAIFWYNASVGAQYGEAIAVDSVIVEEYLCTTPKDIEYTNRTANEVSLKWFGGKCKNFEYVLSRYAKLGNPALIDAEDKVAYGTLTEGPAVTLTNLMPQTKYSFYVRTICEDGTTDWVEYDFLTPCGKYDLPYTEIFAETPECWTLSAASVATQKYKTSDMETAETWTCLQLNKGGLAILPELNVPMNKVQIDLEVFNSTNLGAVSIGVMDNTWDPSTFKEIKFCQTEYKLTGTSSSGNPYTLEPFSYMLNLYQGEGKVLAIKNATDNVIYVKDVKLTELPDCVKPQQIEILELTENAITIHWIAGVEEAWEIKLNDLIIENVTTNQYRITGLEQGTEYEVSVRALCDAEHTSEWSVPTKFQTNCGVNPLPLFEDFSGLVANEKPAVITCWDNFVTEGKIEQVFNGSEKPFKAPANTYYTNMWIAYESSWGATADQLMFFGFSFSSAKYKYRWMITPQYAIEGSATLSFDLRCIDNKGTAAHPDGRFIVAISTDNGETWNKENATQFVPDSVYTTKSVSLDKYVGQNIRVAFYMEDLGGTTTAGKGSGLFTFIDNVRMNCTEEYAYTDNACQGYAYEGNGFEIQPEDLPVAGADSTYYRFAANKENGCDSVIALTITTRTASEIAPVYATICQGEVYEFGGQNLTEPNPVGKPYFISGANQYGCDSTIYLYLTVAPADTSAVVEKTIHQDDSYIIDEFFTLPAETAIGVTVDTIVKTNDCSFNHYVITLICHNDTTTIPVEIAVDELPYKVDEIYTIPEGTPVGSYEEVLPNGNECSYNLYVVTITDVITGLINLSDEVERIEVYDALGRKVRSIRHGEEQYQLPTGVYMLQTIMKSGAVVNHKATLK